MCEPLDWQIDCAGQVCGALMPAPSGAGDLTLNLYELTLPTEWQNGEIDRTTTVARTSSDRFVAVNALHICSSLSEEEEIGSDPGLLPPLCENSKPSSRECVCLARSFKSRRIAGRPIRRIWT